MRRLIRVVVAVLPYFLCSVACYAADWTLYSGEAGQAGSRYYDKQSVKKLPNGFMEVTALSNGTHGSNASVFRIDCAGKRIQSMSMKEYSEKMGQGKLGPLSSNTALPIKSLQTASELDPHKAQLFDLVCEMAR
jgi:hypothetical protein